jgi:hypothetical protein
MATTLLIHTGCDSVTTKPNDHGGIVVTIEKMGGHLDKDQTQLDLSYTSIKDADVAQLKVFKNLEALD